MKYIIDRDKIREGDDAFTSRVGLFPLLEKWTINGFGKAITDFRQKLPVHILRFVKVFGHLKILEMVQDNNEKGRMKLTLTAIEKYEDNGAFGDRIICVKRNRLYDDPHGRQRANDRHLARWAENNTFYEVKELPRFIPFINKIFSRIGIKNDNSRFVCSSEIESELNQDGYTYKNFPLVNSDGSLKVSPGLISPFDIMSAKYVSSRDGNRFDYFTVDGIYKH